MTGIEAACFGTLTRDADHRTSKAGKPFTLLNVVVGEGETRQFVSATVFGDAAMKVANLKEGRHVYIEGRIEISEWTGQDGVKRSWLKIASFKAEEVAKIGGAASVRAMTDSRRPNPHRRRDQETILGLQGIEWVILRSHSGGKACG
jgi:single-stranded DNA-binding protein